MNKLWLKFRNHPNLTKTINDFNNQELSIRIEMEKLPVGSTLWCMHEMKRITLLSECKTECIENLHRVPRVSDECTVCNVGYFMDLSHGLKVCKSCGLSFTLILDDKYDYATSSRYNGNRRHHYDPTEHFYQSLYDFTCTGARNTPPHVFLYCLRILGRGKHVTSDNVFKALQRGKFRAYYLHKYDIANRLRGFPEFKITSFEISQMRDVYVRYRSEFIPFQQAHYIGTCSKNGKPRLYWPMRYILKRVCEEIERPDLKKFIRDICDKEKVVLYDKYWYKLKHFVDSTRPKRNKVNPSFLAARLKQTGHS